MIRHRLSELDRAVARAIEMLRAAKYVEEVAEGVLELLGQAACSERATFWTADADLPRLRVLASWSTEACSAPTRQGGIRHRTASLSQANAGHVWRSRKPLWSTSVVLDIALPPPTAGLRGGVWFAVKTDTSVYGVIELLGHAIELKTPDNLVVVERLGFRLGHALEELRHGNARLH
jgi:hypothetical protein